jgi:hypothetical protein
MGPGITARLTSVRAKRQISLILAAAYPWKGRADFGVRSPSRRPNETKCLNCRVEAPRSRSVRQSRDLGGAKRVAQKVAFSTTILMLTVIAADSSAEIATRIIVSRQVIRDSHDTRRRRRSTLVG